MISWFSGNCSTSAAQRRTPICETEVVVSAWWSSVTLWGRCLAVVECDILRKVDWTLGLIWHPLPDVTPMDFFLWGCLKEHIYAVPPRTTEHSWQDFKEVWEWSLPTCQGKFERMSCGMLSFVLKWMEATPNAYCNYEAPMVLSFDSAMYLES
jgi:hypothetical protein